MGSQPLPWREINADHLTGLTVKAEGAGATVYHAILPPDSPSDKPIPVALRKPRITSSVALQRFDSELELRSSISHPHLLPLLAACTTPPDYSTISPWMSGGTLFDLIHTRSVSMSFPRLLSLATQLADAMSYMHTRNLVHRDLKTANILLDSLWEHLVVADLDLAIDVAKLRSAASTNSGRALHRGPSNGRLSHMVGTLIYMAPEVLSGAPHSFPADVYAFAITINEMATAAVPFVDRKMPVPELHTVLETRFNEVRLRGAIVKDGLRPVLATGVPDEYRALIEQCWHPDPDARPTFQKILSVLRDIASHGDDFLSQFTGSAMPMRHVDAAMEHEAARADAALFAQLRSETISPSRPMWLSQLARHGAFARWLAPNAGHPPRKPLDVKAALSSTCGQRGEDSMEDRSIVMHEVAGLSNSHLFAVFDGHGGQACSDFAAIFLPGALARAWTNEDATPESALIHAFEDVDRTFLYSSGESENSGCTALAALVVDTVLFVANAGDCRCVLGTTDGKTEVLSKDHVAMDSGEMARIKARGGYVTGGRVQGRLMVSRALGDRPVKQYISATPDVVTRHLSETDDFIILASDGLWDVVSNEEAVSMVHSTVRVPDMAAKRLALKAIELGSDDNVSVIVVFLNGVVSYSQM